MKLLNYAKSGTKTCLIVASILNASYVLCQPLNSATRSSDSAPESYSMQYKIKGMSPQTASMIMYDKIPVLQNSGRLDLSIPIIHFQDPDFEFPISVRYDSEGFRPNEPDNFVGRDWSLECGGLIYREVKGKPDDMPSDPTTAGFLWNVQLSKRDPETVKKNLLSGSPLSYIGTFLTEDALAFKDNSYQGEFSSDIYHFCFGGHSGKFMIDFDGSVIVSGNDGRHYTVDISRYRLWTEGQGYSSEIRISTDDGYTYCFGGSYGAVDYIALVWEPESFPVWPILTKNRISGFHLSRIIAPNGRELKISYLGEEINQEYHDKPALLIEDGRYDELINKGYNRYYSYVAAPFKSQAVNCFLYNSYINVDYTTSPLIREEGIRQTLIKAAIISKISTDDTEIVFSYASRNNVKIDGSYISKFGMSCGARLVSVSMKSKKSGRTIETTSFKHSYQRNAYMFLESICNSVEGTHSFEYNSVSSSPCTENIDYWGYCRKESASPQGILPEVTSSLYYYDMSSNDIEYIGDERSPIFNDVSSGLLKRITFPTGGMADITYEQNEYASYFVKNSSTSYRKTLVDGDINHPCGGARILKLEFKDNNMDIVKRTIYKYTDSPDNARSSGILSYIPQYYHIWRSKGIQRGDYFLLYSSDGFCPAENSNPFVTYSTVTEYTSDSEIQTTRPDYPHGMAISPTENDKTISQTTEIGLPDPAFPDKEQADEQFCRWELTIEPPRDDNGSGRISIYKMGTGTVFDKTVNGDSDQYVRYYETINPVKQFGPGRYVIELTKTGLTYVRFDPYSPDISASHVDGYATVTRYTDYHTNPDEYPADNMIFQCKDMLSPDSAIPAPELDGEYLRHNFLEPVDRSLERGQVLSQTLLTDTGDTVQTVDYAYVRLESGKFGLYAAERPVVVNAITASLFASINKEPFYSYKPVGRFTKTYDIISGSCHTQCEHWRYSNEGYMTRHSIDVNAEDMKETYYKYCHQMEDYDKRFYGKLGEEAVELNGPEGTCSRVLTRYFYNDKGKISSVEVCNSSGEVIAYEHFSGFDRYGNPTGSLNNSGLRKTYIWGYCGRYPVAVIENASPEEVSDALGFALETISQDGEKYMPQINSLRASMPEAMVTTYSWIPLVGMSEKKDPSGTSTLFSYDSANRLESERIAIGGEINEPIKSYMYNLVNGIGQ